MTTQPTTPPQHDAERAALEEAYRQALSVVATLAKALNKPSPIVTRAERRQAVDARARLEGRPE